jgi:uncharacterized protein (DUF433 family)
MADSPAASTVAATTHIEISPDICGGKPRIAGSRIRVQDIVIWHDRMGLSADEIVSRYPHLPLAGVYAALAYYHDHRLAIDADMESGRALVEEMRRLYPSKLHAKLAELEAQGDVDELQES